MSEHFAWSDKMKSLREMDEDSLRALRVELQSESDIAKEAISEAKRDAYRGGEPSSFERIVAMERRHRAIGRDIQTVCSEFGRRKRIRHEEAQSSNKARVVATRTQQAEVSTFERRFVDAAKLMLPARQFRDICRAASGVIDMTPNPERDQDFTPELSR